MASGTTRSAVMDRLRRLSNRNNLPLFGTFELTYRCQLSCRHCYLDPDDPYGEEMEVEGWLELLRELARMGCLMVIFTGGEPTLHPGFWEMVAECRRLGIFLRIYTNAYELSDEDLERFVIHGVRSFHVSLHTDDAGTQDGIAGVPGAHERIADSIRRMSAAGLTVVVGSMMLKDTYRRHDGTRRMILGLGGRFRPSTMISPSNMGRPIPESEMLDFHECAELNRHGGPRAPRPEPAEDDVLYAVPCSAGSDSFSVTPDGTVMPCLQIRLPLGNVRRQSFSRIWRHSPQRFYLNGMRNLVVDDCRDCDDRGACMRCPGIALIENGSLWRAAPTICRHTAVARQ